jgi:proline iminopeptidase
MPTRPGLVLLLALVVLCAAPSTQAAESGRTFAAGGVTLYYEALGPATGTPLVLVNGGPGFDHSYLHVSKVWEEMAKRRPIVLYDQRGTGRSTAAEKPGGLADQIADLEALRQHLAAERIDLFGTSWGGYLVMAYTARHPEHVRRLIIADSAAPKWSETKFLFKEMFPDVVERQEALAFAGELGDKKAKEDSLREYFSMIFYAAEGRDAFLAAAGSFQISEAVNKALNADVARFDLGPELPKFKCPTLVMTGRFDVNVAPATAYGIHQAIPGSRFVVFEKSGHMPFIEEPARFIQVMEEFLGAGHK